MINDYLECVKEQLEDACCELSIDNDEAVQMLLIANLIKIEEHLNGIEFNLRRFARE